ncbi:hypothetical protein F1654_08840 [Alkalicaulis satelles]|uniref:DUF4276 family protein n=2 Tax=Alkalicaulis satelles TaxID=2609175 RepID=A0A5M6ZGK7_9PROT|nr:hypothetical protein F1654_08840 [Alkalicaulis satelles]
MERDFIEAICGRRFPIRIIPNGNTVCKERLWKHISTHLRALRNSHQCAIIWIDHESNPEPIDEVISYLKLECKNELGPGFDLRIGIANKMKENWMLADEIAMQNHYGHGYVYDPDYEGSGGKTKIKSFAKKCDDNYLERVDGVQILRNSCIYRMARNSASAAIFLSQMQGINCAWFWRNGQQ